MKKKAQPLSLDEAISRFKSGKEKVEAEREFRHDRSKHFLEVFSKEVLNRLSDREWEKRFRKIMRELWAFGAFRNKDYRIDLIIRENGLQNLKKYLSNLLYGNGSIGERYEQAKSKLKLMGDSTLTEILCFTSEGRYPLWNRRAVEASRLLQLSGLPLSKRKQVPKSYVSGKEYEQIVKALTYPLERLKREGLGEDFRDLDYLFFLVQTGEIWKWQPPEELTHHELVRMVKEVGCILDFAVREEVWTPSGAYRCDVTWSDYEGHAPIKVFEIELSHNVDHALSSLKDAYDLWRAPCLYLVVMDERDMKRARKLIEPKLRGAFRRLYDKIRVYTAKEIKELYDGLKPHNEILREFAKRRL